jgi:hypothetical protein
MVTSEFATACCFCYNQVCLKNEAALDLQNGKNYGQQFFIMYKNSINIILNNIL